MSIAFVVADMNVTGKVKEILKFTKDSLVTNKKKHSKGGCSCCSVAIRRHTPYLLK